MNKVIGIDSYLMNISFHTPVACSILAPFSRTDPRQESCGTPDGDRFNIFTTPLSSGTAVQYLSGFLQILFDIGKDRLADGEFRPVVEFLFHMGPQRFFIKNHPVFQRRQVKLTVYHAHLGLLRSNGTGNIPRHLQIAVD